MAGSLRIAQVAPPIERVPPEGYGGTERIVYELVRGLLDRGHEVTTFASGDSDVAGRLVPTAPEALRPSGYGDDPLGWMVATQLEVLRRADEFDVIHSHLEWASLPLLWATRTPVVSTFHGRMDLPFARSALADRPAGIVAISHSQASVHPDLPWAAVIYNGLTLDDTPFERDPGDHLVFVGRIDPDKGVLEAIEVARNAGRRLVIGGKVGTRPWEREYYETVFRPAIEHADVEFLGEVQSHERDQLLAGAYATLMPGAWPEPFGLVSIESLACGTPVLARRVGALPEIVREGVDGYFGDDPRQIAFLVDRVAELDRAEIRRSVRERFAAARMVEQYEALYRHIVADGKSTGRSGQRGSQAAEAVAPGSGRQGTPARRRRVGAARSVRAGRAGRRGQD